MTLKEAGLELGLIDEATFDRVVKPEDDGRALKLQVHANAEIVDPGIFAAEQLSRGSCGPSSLRR